MAKAEKVNLRAAEIDVSAFLSQELKDGSLKGSASSLGVSKLEAPQQVTWEAGHELSVARLNAGLTLLQVASMLKMPVKHIEALEWGTFYVLPSQVYVVGYLRLYSRLLHLDEEKVVNNYKRLIAHAQKEAAPIAADQRHPSQTTSKPQAKASIIPFSFFAKFKYHLILLIVLLAGLALLYFMPLLQRQQITEPEVVDSTLLQAVPVGKVAQLEVTGSDSLKFHFFESSYLKVQDSSGLMHYEKKHQVGDSLELSGQAPFRVTLEKGTAVGISLNGKTVEIPISAENRPVEFGIAK